MTSRIIFLRGNMVYLGPPKFSSNLASNGTKTELLVHSPCSFICVQSCTCKLVFLGVASSKVTTYIHLERVCQFTRFTCVGGCRANTGKCGVMYVGAPSHRHCKIVTYMVVVPIL